MKDPAFATIFHPLIILLTLGLVLSTATQLRFSFVPIGPGEIVLLAWIMISGAYIFVYGRLCLSKPARYFLIFWACFFLILISGWIFSLQKNVWDSASGSHNIFAYLFNSLLTVMFLVHPTRRKLPMNVACLLLIIGITVLLLLLFLDQVTAIGIIGKLSIWRPGAKGFRFIGWARNPNQMALFLCPLPFVALFFWAQARQWIYKLWWLFGAACATWLGYLTRSDALLVSWLSGALCMFLAYLGLLRKKVDSMAKYVCYLLAFGGLLVCIFLVLVTLPYIEAYILEVYELGGQGLDRFVLWSNGLKAIHASPVVGLGPGAYSSLAGELNKEAHNTFIDLGTNTGLLGILLFLWLIFYIMRTTWKNVNGSLLAATVAIICFSMFHYVVRHPIFWFYFIITPLLGDAVPVQAKLVPKDSKQCPDNSGRTSLDIQQSMEKI